jgi:hypothetical protein
MEYLAANPLLFYVVTDAGAALTLVPRAQADLPAGNP